MALTEKQLKAGIEFFTILAQIDQRLNLEKKFSEAHEHGEKFTDGTPENRL